jgi:hypothetical protein
MKHSVSPIKLGNVHKLRQQKFGNFDPPPTPRQQPSAFETHPPPLLTSDFVSDSPNLKMKNPSSLFLSTNIRPEAPHITKKFNLHTIFINTQRSEMT